LIINGACYIRVSTDDQTEFSPDAQLKALKEYAKRNNIILSKEHIYIDEGISGKRADKRPAFQLMIKTAKSKPKPFDVILVHKFDRFARSREDSVVYKSLLKKEAGVRVVSITEHLEDDKFSVILEAMLEAMACESYKYVVPVYYETMIKEKVMRDQDTVEMLELIAKTRVYDPGFIYNFGGCYDFYVSLTSNKGQDFSSSYAKIEKKIISDIDKFVALFTE